MLDKLKEILNLKSELSKNVLTLVTGTTIAQAIPIAISPILTRIYTPEDFGVLALFISITTILGTIANGRYELAIVLPKRDNNALEFTALSIIITMGFSLLLVILVILFHDSLLSYLNNDRFSFWLYLIPLSVLLFSLFNILNYYHTRKKEYKIITKARMSRSVVMALIQTLVGLLFRVGGGLIGGSIVSYIAGNYVMLRNRIGKHIFGEIQASSLLQQGKRYINFPKYSLFGSLANILSIHVISIFITTVYSATILGFYSLVYRVLAMPLTLIGNSLGQVYLQEAVEEKNKTGITIVTFRSTLIKLVAITIPIFGILYLFIDDLFAFIFGNEWQIAGVYAKILLPLFFIRFIVSPLTVTCSIFEKQKIALIWQAFFLVNILLVFLISYLLEISFTDFLTAFNWFSFLQYLFILAIIIKLARDGKLIK